MLKHENFHYNRKADSIHGFIAKDMDTLRWVIERCWDTIADDLFFDHEKNKIDYSILYDRFEVAEISLDTDRWRDVNVDEKEFEIILDMLRDLGCFSIRWKEVIRETLPNNIYGY